MAQNLSDPAMQWLLAVTPLPMPTMAAMPHFSFAGERAPRGQDQVQALQEATIATQGAEWRQGSTVRTGEHFA